MQTGAAKNRRNKVYYYAISMGLSHEEAEDAVQELELRLIEGLGKKQTAKHFVIDYLRRQGFDQSKGLPSIHDARLELKADPSAWSDPTKVTRLEEGLRGYSLDERVMIILKNIWGLTAKEIGFVLGLNELTILNKLRELDL